ncbi:MAG: DUF2076 family protein [Betaproteobacteria bacterium]|nr:DUF2076 family protein [Betaproteobacteria bacterium]
MTPQEREHLAAFLQQMTQMQAGQKDAEADALIREAATRQPDAAYLLVQRAMGLDYALQATQAQAAKLQTELDQSRSGARSSFLDTSNAWGRPMPAQGAAPVAAAPAPLARAASQAAPAAAAPGSSWGSGILGTVATTAAGVVAGAFLYQGIQSLMGHHNTPANTGTNPAALPPESGKLASDADERPDALDDSADYADAANGDFDSGDSV